MHLDFNSKHFQLNPALKGVLLILLTFQNFDAFGLGFSLGVGFGQDSRFETTSGVAFSGDLMWEKGPLHYGFSAHKMIATGNRITGMEVAGLSLKYQWMKTGLFFGARFIDGADRWDDQHEEQKILASTGFFIATEFEISKNFGVEAKVIYENKIADLPAAILPQVLIKYYLVR